MTEPASSPVTFEELGEALGVCRSQLRAHVAAGMPVAIRGARGRGRVARFDVATCRQWIACRRRGDAAPVVALSVAPEALRGFVDGLDVVVREAPEPARAAAAVTAVAAWLVLLRQLPASFAALVHEPDAVRQWRALAAARGHRLGNVRPPGHFS